MIWDQLIYDVKHRSGELFTGVTRDAFMTRQDILNIDNDTKRKDYVKDESDPKSVECWFNECTEIFFLPKTGCCSKHPFYHRHTNEVDAVDDG